ncbi:MAG: efflux RND transporter periplasmic adaptor subunit [Epsilonproteobacteria bacterium]|nr:efflux RND transporter periplasmic adaptor subunit [Campylobacterota bacterium]
MKTLLIIAFLSLFSHAKTFEQAFNVQIIQPKLITHSDKRSYYATTAYDEGRIYDVTLRYEGFIQNLVADERYKTVTKGQKLFDIYSKEIYELKKELASSQGFEPLQRSIREKLSLYEIDQNDMKNLSSTTPYISKYGGIILEKKINEGGFAKAGMSLFKIADNSVMWVIAKVYQKDYAFIAKGMEAIVEIDGIAEPIRAKVSKIYPFVSSKDQSFEVRIEVPNSHAKIFDGMFAKVTLSKNARSALSLPKEAVIKREGKLYVFKQSAPSEYEPTEIEALYAGGYYQIQSGISESDFVAKDALFLLDSDAVTNGSYMSEKW